MKISPKVCLSKNQKVIACVCEKTGITSALVVPSIPPIAGKEQVFEYQHPLSYWSNAQGMIKAGRSYLEKLEPNTLAGLILIAYEHFDLLDRYTLSAQEANAVLCTASDDTLVELCSLASYFDSKNTKGTPALVLEWNDVRYMVSIDRMLAGYVKGLRAEFINPSVEEEKKGNNGKITVLNLNAKSHEGRTYKSGVQLLSSKQSMADHEKEFESTFKAAKKELKELLLKHYDLAGNYGLPELDSKLANFIKTISQGRSLVAMSDDIRAKLCAKLEAYKTVEASRMAILIKQCHNPYDIFAKADDLLDRASDTFVKSEKPRSLAEILAAKRLKAKELSVAEQVTSDQSSNSLPDITYSVDPMNPTGTDDVDELLSTRIIEGGSDEEGSAFGAEEELEEELKDLVDIYQDLSNPQDF